MTDILVVRHGQSTWNAEGRWSGRADPPLTAAGMEAAELLAGDLAGFGFDAVAASDLLRARATAEILARALALPPPRIVAGLRERDMGFLEGRTRDEIEAVWPGWTERWRREEAAEIPGGEPRHEFDRRILAALREAGSGGGTERLLVVAHAGTLRAVARHVGVPAGPWANLAGIRVELRDGSLLWKGPAEERVTP